MSPTNNNMMGTGTGTGPGQFGDTTYTKVFVGGLAWETQKETMKNYFEQFGEILEAVVITDKSTGRSKGYGFVTFKEAEAAMKACIDAAPVIDGRRANCNLASLGVQRSKPSTPKHATPLPAGGGNTARSFRVMNAFQAAVGGGGGGGGGGLGTAFTSATTYPHYPVHQGIPYNFYGYSAYSGDYAYPASYYNMYGGAAAAQYPMYGSNGGGMMTGAYYPYMNLGAEGSTTTAANIHYPHNFFNYSPINAAAAGAYPHHYATGAPISLPPATPAGVTMALRGTMPSR